MRRTYRGFGGYLCGRGGPVASGLLLGHRRRGLPSGCRLMVCYETAHNSPARRYVARVPRAKGSVFGGGRVPVLSILEPVSRPMVCFRQYCYSWISTQLAQGRTSKRGRVKDDNRLVILGTLHHRWVWLPTDGYHWKA